MKFRTRQDFATLAELTRFYSDFDEIVFKNHCDLDEQEIADLCRNARRLVHHLRLHHGTKRAADIAQAYGIVVIWEDWQKTGDGEISLARHTTHPPSISLNMDAIKSLADLMQHWANENELMWFTEQQIAEVATAHQLCCLIESRMQSSELAAHVFARAFTALPFSPLLYSVLLIRLVKGKGSTPR
jgi:hypothetical protein